MDGIGVGPSGPPLPPEAIFSVVPYPIERDVSSLLGEQQRYTFVASGNQGEGTTNIIVEDPSKSDVSELDGKPAVDKKVRWFLPFLALV